jgi:Leucine-rich repeat (LRR) protein
MLDDIHYYFVCKTHFSENFACQRKSRNYKEQPREGNKQHKREHTECNNREQKMHMHIEHNKEMKNYSDPFRQCTALTHLDLSSSDIGSAGAESFAGVLLQCTALSVLDLTYNDIEDVGKGRLRASWRGQAYGLLL